MSPNLSSSHFKHNKLLYEQVLLNVLSLVGVATYFHGIERQTIKSVSILCKFFSLFSKDLDLIQTQVSDKDINIFIQECYEKKCETCKESFVSPFFKIILIF